MEKITLPKTFSQNDPRWKASMLGSKGTIGAFGCLMTDAATIANYYGANEDPLTLNEKLKANGGYQGGNLFVWGVFANLFGLKYSGKFSNPSDLTKAQMDQIKAAIDKGYPVLLQIDTIPATSQLDEHWILAIGYDGDDFIVQDPWDGVKKRITSWGVAPQKLIYDWCWYEGKVPSAATQQNNQTITITTAERDHLVNGATVRKDVATYLGIADPDHAQTDSITKVIAGIKGSQTQAAGELASTQKAKAEVDQQLANKTEELARVKQECQEQTDFLKSQVDSLNKQLKNNGEPLRDALSRVEVLLGQLDAANKKYGNVLIEKTKLESDLNACRKGVVSANFVSSFTNFFKKNFKK